eukprot:2163984-Rhodomonas_salina.1
MPTESRRIAFAIEPAHVVWRCSTPCSTHRICKSCFEAARLLVHVFAVRGCVAGGVCSAQCCAVLRSN